MTAKIVVGRYSDGSGMSDWAYGPFVDQRADQIAKALSDGDWYHMEWTTLPLQRLMGAPANEPGGSEGPGRG